MELYLGPAPTATAVRIEADLPAGARFSIRETRIYVTLDEDDEESSSSTLSWIIFIVFVICCCGCGGCIYSCCCHDKCCFRASAIAVANASVSSSAPQHTHVVRPSAPVNPQ